MSLSTIRKGWLHSGISRNFTRNKSQRNKTQKIRLRLDSLEERVTPAIPVAVADAYTVDEAVRLVIPAANGLLANDSDADSDPMSVVLTGGPYNGVLLLKQDGGFVYQSGPEFSGTDTFSYRASDGTSESADTTVTITVNAVNDAPIAGTAALSGLLASNITISPESNAFEPTAIAFDGTRSLMVYKEQSNIYGRFVESDGTAGTPFLINGRANNQLEPDVAFNGTHYLVVWHDNFGITNGDSIAGQLVSTSGALVGTDFIINDPNASNSRGQPVIASDGSGFLVAWDDARFTSGTDFRDIVAQRINVSGGVATRAGSDVLVSTIGGTHLGPGVAYGGGKFLIAWKRQVIGNQGNWEVQAATMTPAGVASAPFAITTSADPRGSEAPSISFGGGNFLVVWGENRSNVTEAIGARVSSSGNVLDATGILLSRETPFGYWAARPTTAFDGSEWLIMWLGSSTQGTRLRPDGTFPHSGDLSILPYYEYVDYARLAFTGNNFLLTWQGNNATNYQRHAQVIGRRGLDLTASMQEDASVGITLAASDVEGDPLTYTIGSPANGTLTGTAPNLTYTPNANFFGSDSFTYTVNDGNLDSNVATVSLTVSLVNDAPVNSLPGPQTTNEDVPLSFSTANGNAISFSDVDAGSTSMLVALNVSNGTLWLNDLTGVTLEIYPNGSNNLRVRGTMSAVNAALQSLEYRPATNFNGSSTLWITTTDSGPTGAGWGTMSDSDSIAITVQPVNDPPTMSTFSVGMSTSEDTPLNGSLLSYGPSSDVDGDTLSIVVVDYPDHGTIELGANQSFIYTPELNYFGPDSFSFRKSDGQYETVGIGTVNLSVAPVNDAPVALDDPSYVVDEDSFLAVESPGPLANDSDPVEGSPVSMNVQTYPQNGSLNHSWDGSFTYTPNPNFSGTDTFTYRAYDEWPYAYSELATVTITVNPQPDAPVALADNYSVLLNGNLNVAGPGVLGNDSDPDGDSLTATVEAGPAHGTLSFNVDGSFDYSPAAGFVGIDSFTYRASDGGLQSEPALVSIVVTTQLVTTLDDSGPGSLRDAIDAANTNAGADVIGFEVAGPIEIASDLPALNDATGGTTIRAFPSADGSPSIALNGTGSGTGLVIASANNEVRGLRIGNFETGILIQGTLATGNVIAGNHIGVSYSLNSTDEYPNANGIIIDGAPGNWIGVTGANDADGRNLFAFNQTSGITITGSTASGNTIAGNSIGGWHVAVYDSFETYGNPGAGIVISDAPGNTIGGTNPFAANFIDGNQDSGIRIEGNAASANLIQGNIIGGNENNGSGNEVHGIAILDAPNNVIGGTEPGAGNFLFYNYETGIRIEGIGATGNVIQGNRVEENNDNIYVLDAADNTIGGTVAGAGNRIAGGATTGVRLEGSSATGNLVQGNVVADNSDGIALFSGANQNTIGGTTPEARNFIYLNHNGGVYIDGGDNNIIQGNYIGTDETGMEARGNFFSGVVISSGSGNLIGGTAPGAGNVISANQSSGVESYGFGNIVQGNLIGTDATGVNPLGNWNYGIYLGGSSEIIGGTEPGAGNVIAYTGHPDYPDVAGVIVGNPGGGNVILSNSIYGNHGPGIFYDEGYPVVTVTEAEGTPTGTHVAGTLIGIPDSDHLLQFFSTEEDPNGNSQGRHFIGSVTVTTDGGGNAAFDTTLSGTIAWGSFITATATVDGSGTFEFSQAFEATVDWNDDGTPDDQQTQLASVPNVVDGAYVTLETATGSLAGVEAVAGPEAGSVPPGIDFPIGAFVFTVEGIAQGADTTVTIDLPAGVSVNTYYKFDAALDEWTEFLYDGTTGAQIFVDHIVLHLVDGGRGDSDGVANGSILDPGAPAVRPNNAPTANADSYSVNENATLTIAAPGVLGNDSDLDGNSLSAILVGNVSNGALTLNSDGSFVYIPNTDFVGSDSFTYKVSDGSAESGIATVTITVNAVNETPVATDDAYELDQDTTLTIAAPGLLANDSDADGDSLTAAVASGPAHGSVVVNADGSFTYTPNAGYTGADSFTYTVSDGNGGSATATVSLTINASGSGAFLQDDPCEPGKTALVVRGTDSNDDIVVTPSSGGAVSVSLNGTSLGTFNPTGRILVYGLAGNDDLQTSGSINRSVWLFGGVGADRLKGGGGHDVLIGGEGDDLLVGGQGRDLLIGGFGSDRIVGNADEDILIAGTADCEGNHEALCAIMVEWTSNLSFDDRVDSLLYGDGTEGSGLLNANTLHDDGASDVLTGSSGIDWFIFNADSDNAPDQVTDLSTYETLYAEDMAFINEEI